MIVINATAIDGGGALTILNQFIHHASKDADNSYLFFIYEELEFHNYDNMVFIKLNKKTWLKRIFWDFYGLKRFLVKNNINYSKLISLQNTSVNIDVGQILYIHQSLPFNEFFFTSKVSLNIKFLLYRFFYSFFIFRFVDANTEYIVQTNWMQKALIDKYKIKLDKIHVITPTLFFPEVKPTSSFGNRGNLFLYPASLYLYKNHMIILKAMVYLNNQNKLKNFEFLVTFNEGEFKEFDQFVIKNNLYSRIKYLGNLNVDDLVVEYQNCKAVLFPSYIETYGLPLAEAAFFGKKIICSDLAYSRDVLGNYKGVVYVDYDCYKSWANSILDVILSDDLPKFKFDINRQGSWDYLFDSIIKKKFPK